MSIVRVHNFTLIRWVNGSAVTCICGRSQKAVGWMTTSEPSKLIQAIGAAYRLVRCDATECAVEAYDHVLTFGQDVVLFSRKGKRVGFCETEYFELMADLLVKDIEACVPVANSRLAAGSVCDVLVHRFETRERELGVARDAVFRRLARAVAEARVVEEAIKYWGGGNSGPDQREDRAHDGPAVAQDGERPREGSKRVRRWQSRQDARLVA